MIGGTTLVSENRCIGDLEEGQRILDTPKYFDLPIIMQKDNNKPSLYNFSGSPVYETQSTENIVGLSIFLRTNVTIDSMKHSFGLVQRIGRQMNWIYDLCIYPEHQRSHVDRIQKKVYYGPHAHILDKTIEIKLEHELNDWNKWFQVFAQNINLEILSNDIIEPLAGELLL